MSKDSSAEYYQDTKERLKKVRVRYQSLSKEDKKKKERGNKEEKKKRKRDNMVVKDRKIYQDMKNKSWLSIEK